jgi:hypothetical protein
MIDSAKTRRCHGLWDTLPACVTALGTGTT